MGRRLLRGRVPDADGHPGQPHGDGPGGYKFSDYWKYGLPLLILYGVVVIFYIPLIWHF